jgi:hypothetical protein
VKLPPQWSFPNTSLLRFCSPLPQATLLNTEGAGTRPALRIKEFGKGG